MKKYLLLPTLLMILMAAGFSGCDKKGIINPVTLDRAAGKWIIHGIRYKISTGPSNSRDSTIPWRPAPENFVTFDGKSALQYAFNTSTSTSGTYNFFGEDSVVFRLNGVSTKWKVMLLTDTNFNIENTSTDNTNFPGATVVTYQGFIR